MMKYFVVLYILIANIAFADSGATKIVAYVGDDIISSLDVENRVRLVRIINASDKIKNTSASQLRSQVLDMLIDEKLYRQEAARLKIFITPDELLETVETIQKRNGITEDFDSYIKKNKLSKESVVSQIESQLLWTKIIGYKIRPLVNVSQREIDDAIENMGMANYNIEMRQVTVRYPETAKKQELQKFKKNLKLYNNQIRSCDAIVDLKNRFGIDFEEKTIQAELNDLRQDLKTIISKTPTGRFTNLIENESNLQMLMVCSRDKLEEEFQEREEIESLLLQKKVMQQADYYLKELRQKTLIDSQT